MSKEVPRITFGIIVLNGEPFVKYCLRTIYPFAYQIIVVEGATERASKLADTNGHSTDRTICELAEFRRVEDIDKKLTIVTRDGYWKDKNEQSQAYATMAKGDYLWQVDIDEFYHSDSIEKVIQLFRENPTISGISFQWINFWGGFDYIVDGWEYRDILSRMNGIRRVFRWGEGYKYVSHRPPTVVDEYGRDLCELNWIGPEASGRLGIFCYHYGMVFPKQARQKTIYYRELWESHKDMEEWYRESYMNLERPLRILHGTKPPSWLKRFKGVHPPQIRLLISHCKDGIISVETRQTEDIEKLLDRPSYRVVAHVLSGLYRFRKLYKRWIKCHIRYMISCVSKRLRRIIADIESYIWTKIGRYPLELMPDSPELFRVYRELAKHPELERVPGGWIYKGKFYPDYLMMGGASFAILKEALRYCKGYGVDVGAGFWPLPGAIPVDESKGPGAGRSIQEFEDASLDYVFSSHCLEHVADWKAVLGEWVRKVKPGGTIFLYLPHPECEIWHPGSPFVGAGHKWIPRRKIVMEVLESLGCELAAEDEGPDAMYSFHLCAKKKEVQ